MTLGGNSIIKTIFHRQERRLVEEYVESFKLQLKQTQEMKEDLTPNPVYIQLKAKIEFGEKLLGKRL